MLHPYVSRSLQAAGTYALTIVTGLVVYQSPPESLDQFWAWMWQPNLQGIMMALGVLGVNAAAKPRVS
jgi:membrane-bound ClpP family serine protease